MNNYQNQTPPPVLRNHHQHQQQQQQQQQQLHHNNHHFSTSATIASAAVPSTIQLTPLHQIHHHLQPNHGMMLQHHQHHFTTPAAASLPPLPPTPQSLAAAAVAVATATATASSSTSTKTNLATPQQQPQPLISNSLAIRQEIQRFESVHPSIYAIYDLIDLLPITDAQIAQQIRDHVVCIEDLMPRGAIVSWGARRRLRKIQKQMPCGWPQHGIPPLAPLKFSEKEVSFKKGILDTMNYFWNFRVDGLDDAEIDKLHINLIFSTIKYDFLFHNIKVSLEKYDTDTLLDAMKQLGISVRYEGDGSVGFSVERLRVAGKATFKVPTPWSSARLISLKTKITLEKCNSNITGFAGGEIINNMINRQIENVVEKEINGNTQKISDIIEDNLVPEINKRLQGKYFWMLVDLMSNEDGNDPNITYCVPSADPHLLT